MKKGREIRRRKKYIYYILKAPFLERKNVFPSFQRISITYLSPFLDCKLFGTK
jgi:hypothetical protein